MWGLPIVNMLVDVDDYQHEATRHPDWRESWYFNWVDPKAKISGFSTIGVLPNLPKREFVFALFVNGTPEFHFNESTKPIPENFKQTLTDGLLSYELVNPFTEWRIQYKSPRFTTKIQWQSRFPAFDFGRGSGTSWGRHLEQSGYITGQIKTPSGSSHHFTGYGQRDKSWGRRDWHIDEWFALHAQFDELMLGLRYDTVKAKTHLSGCVSTKKGNVPLKSIEIKTKFEEGTIRKPINADVRLKDKKGRTFTLNTRLLHPASFARYAREFSEGETELFEQMVIIECDELDEPGTGLAEWLFTHHKK